MSKSELISLFMKDGVIVPKRCTASWVLSHNLMGILCQHAPADFESVSDKVKHLVYGGGYCDTCGTRTNLRSDGKGFNRFCKAHAHDGKKNKPAHNRKEVDVSMLVAEYENNKSILAIASALGISNVTVAAKLKQAGIPLRSHSENQKIHAYHGDYRGPLVDYSHEQAIEEYLLGIPMINIAMKANCNVETIRGWINDAGVTHRHRTSSIEYIMENILLDLDVWFIKNTRKVISPYEVDFWIPEHNLAIECNGLYYHSHFAGNKPKAYHRMKYESCTMKGIRLLQFWEPDIQNKQDIIRSVISGVLRKHTNMLNARSLKVTPLSRSDANRFLIMNHIQGACSPAAHHVGLCNDDGACAVMSYITSKTHTTILRYCSLLNSRVRGGFTKLMNQIPGNVIRTYSDNAISDGALYANTGFTCTSASMNMFYTDYERLYERQSFMKSKLKNLFNVSDFDSMTEIEIMRANGMDVIYGVGTKTWSLARDK